MSDEKIREEFEAWYLLEYFENDKDCGLEWLSTEPCGSYRYELASRYWKIWQASRAAVVVDLPQGGYWAGYDNEHMMESRDVREAIESAGLKVKE